MRVTHSRSLTTVVFAAALSLLVVQRSDADHTCFWACINTDFGCVVIAYCPDNPYHPPEPPPPPPPDNPGGGGTQDQPCGDDRDNIIAEYTSRGISRVPQCSTFSNSGRSTYFTFSELNSGDHSWAWIEQVLWNGLDQTRLNYGFPLQVTSGYRCPDRNIAVGSRFPRTSRHIFGRAADLRSVSPRPWNQDERNRIASAGRAAGAEILDEGDHVHVEWEFPGGGGDDGGEASGNAGFGPEGNSCFYALSDYSAAFGYRGGIGSVTVSAAENCGWAATSNDTWLTITEGATGSGTSTLSYGVATNNAADRAGTISIAGQTFTVSQTAQPPNALPSVTLTAPASGTQYTAPASVAITVNASDPDGTVARVDFYAGSTLLFSDVSAPFAYTWPGVSPGSYTLVAYATDNAGGRSASAPASITVNPAPSVENAAPTAQLTTPTNGATFIAPATIALAANGADSDGSVASVTFYDNQTLLNTDTSAPYSFTWANVTAGVHTITAVATDNSGATGTSAAITVFVNPSANAAPSVVLSAPTNKTAYTAPATISITAIASDSDGSVTQVQFYSGDTLLASRTTAPYMYSWPSVPAGTYQLVARATDNQGATTASSPVTVVVAPGVRTPAELLSDDFEGSSLDAAVWVRSVLSGSQDPSISVAQSGGRLQIGPLLQNTPNSHYNGILSIDTINLTGAYAYVQAAAVPASSSGADMMFTLVLDSHNHYRMVISGGVITCETKIADFKQAIASFSFDPASHRFWAIRHDPATDQIIFQTASGGSAWITRATVSQALDITALKVELKAGTHQTEQTSPGIIAFDNLFTAKSAPPMTEFLSDTFTGSTIDPTKWVRGVISGTQDSNISVAQTGDRLIIGPLLQNTANSHYNGVVSTNPFNLTDGFAYVQAVQTPPATTAADMMFTVVVDGSNHYRIYVEAGMLVFQQKITDQKQTLRSITYDPATHHYWAIRHDGPTDRIVFQTARAGSPWVTWASVVRRFSISAVKFELKAGTYQAESIAPGSVLFDNAKSGKGAAPTPAAEMLEFTDAFSGALNATRWSVSVLSGLQDPTVTVQSTGGSLSIGPLLQNAAGSHYNGVLSFDALDLTAACAQVQAIQTPAATTAADMMFTLPIDAANHYRILVSNGLLKFEEKRFNVKTLVGSIAFDQNKHAFWRMCHDTFTDRILFETASVAGRWIRRTTAARRLDVTAIKVELKAGTHQAETVAPGTVIFDNVRVYKP